MVWSGDVYLFYDINFLTIRLFVPKVEETLSGHAIPSSHHPTHLWWYSHVELAIDRRWGWAPNAAWLPKHGKLGVSFEHEMRQTYVTYVNLSSLSSLDISWWFMGNNAQDQYGSLSNRQAALICWKLTSTGPMAMLRTEEKVSKFTS